MNKLIFIFNLMLIAFLVTAQDAKKDSHTTYLATEQGGKMDSILNLHFNAVGGTAKWFHISSYTLEKSVFVKLKEKKASLNSLKQILRSPSLHFTNYNYPDHYETKLYREGKLHATFTSKKGKSKGYSHIYNFEVKFPESSHKFIMDERWTYDLGPTFYIMSAIKENRIKYIGKMEAYGKQCYKFVVNNYKVNDNLIIYIEDQNFFIHAASTLKYPDNYGIYSDFRKVNGIIVPHNIKGYDKKKDELTGETKTLDIQIQYNDELDNFIIEDR